MKIILTVILLLMPIALYAHSPSLIKPTTFSMLCYIDTQDDKFTFRDYGFSLNFKNQHGKKQTLSAKTSGTLKNCTTKNVSVTAQIPAGLISFHIEDFQGQAGSTVECTNTIKYQFKKESMGKNCEFIVKSPKYGSYTSSSECTIIVDCDGNLKKPS